jgi:CBS domain-containing protein
MTDKIVCVSPRTTAEEAMAVVTERRIRHLPVVSDDRIHGMVSSGDLTRWVLRGQEFEIGQLVNYVTSKYPA